MKDRLQINALATPLVAFLLVPHMMRTAQQYTTVLRLVVVASEAHYFASIQKDIAEGSAILTTFSSPEFCTPA
jgi:retinol dehydrogenase-12